MFDMNKIGTKIATLRKDKNITQMELADKLGISYQAVSNWERGNSMPDISKLPELSDIFGISIDEILGGSKSSDLVKNITTGEIYEYLQQNEITAEEIIEAAPILKPNQVEEVIESSKIQINFGQLAILAPFVGKEIIDKYILTAIKQQSYIDLKKLIIIAPFASKSTIDECINYAVENKNITIGINQIIALAPFATKDIISKYAELSLLQDENFKTGKLCTIAPFINKESLSKIALCLYQKSGISGFITIAPFLPKDTLSEIVKNEVEKKGLNKTLFNIAPLLPFLNKDIFQDILNNTSLQNSN